MPLIIPSGFSQVTFLFTGVAVPSGAAMTLGINHPADTAADVIASTVGQAFVDEIMPDMVDDVTLASVLCKKGPNATGQSAEVAFGDAGGSASAPASPAVALLIKKQTNFGGRSQRGRFYMPGLPEAAITPGGDLESGNQAGWQTRYDDLYTALDSAGYTPVLLHSNSSDATTLTGFVVDARVATQRRRQRR